MLGLWNTLVHGGAKFSTLSNNQILKSVSVKTDDFPNPESKRVRRNWGGGSSGHL